MHEFAYILRERVSLFDLIDLIGEVVHFILILIVLIFETIVGDGLDVEVAVAQWQS